MARSVERGVVEGEGGGRRGGGSGDEGARGEDDGKDKDSLHDTDERGEVLWSVREGRFAGRVSGRVGERQGNRTCLKR